MTQQEHNDIYAFKMAICNDCDCGKKDECKRFNKEYLSSYDFNYVKAVWECFIPKN